MVVFILSLDYLLKYLILIYLKKNKNLSISNKFPIRVYDYLNNLKIISKIEFSYNKFFLINFIIYFILLILLIIILFNII